MEVLFSILAFSHLGIGAAGSRVGISVRPSSPEPLTKQFEVVEADSNLDESGVLPIVRLMPSAQLSATRQSRIVPNYALH